MYKNKKKIIEFLKQNNIRKYIINDDLSVDVNGDVDLCGFSSAGNPKIKLSSLPIQFNYINGNFDISENSLKDFTGCPNIIVGNFNITENEITSFVGCPQKINKDFIASGNNIKDLSSLNCEIGGNLVFDDNFIDEIYENVRQEVFSFTRAFGEDELFYALSGKVLSIAILNKKLNNTIIKKSEKSEDIKKLKL